MLFTPSSAPAVPSMVSVPKSVDVPAYIAYQLPLSHPRSIYQDESILPLHSHENPDVAPHVIYNMNECLRAYIQMINRKRDILPAISQPLGHIFLSEDL